jgi:hypothetical protein
MAYYLSDRHDVVVSIPTTRRVLTDRRWSYKLAKKCAQERNKELRSHWRAKRLFREHDQLLFIDESAASPPIGDRKRGWSAIGLPCFDVQRLRREKRLSVVSALSINGYLQHPSVMQGAIMMEAFEEWFESKVLPQLMPGMIVVMDNPSIHWSDLVRQLWPDFGIQLEFLLLYSPDLNPIEESFNMPKAWVLKRTRIASISKDFGSFMEHAAGAATVKPVW